MNLLVGKTITGMFTELGGTARWPNVWIVPGTWLSTSVGSYAYYVSNRGNAGLSFSIVRDGHVFFRGPVSAVHDGALSIPGGIRDAIEAFLMMEEL